MIMANIDRPHKKNINDRDYGPIITNTSRIYHEDSL